MIRDVLLRWQSQPMETGTTTEGTEPWQRKAARPRGSADPSELAASVSGGAAIFRRHRHPGNQDRPSTGGPDLSRAWTSFGVAAEDLTRIAIQEWSKEDRTWTVIEVIRPGTLGRDQFPPLQPENFPGRYDRERVLTVFKAPEKPGE